MTRIVSNYKARPLLSGFEIPAGALRASLKKEFDHLETDEDFDRTAFFQYHKEWYCMDQFSRIANADLLRKGWQGYLGETVWSAMLIGIRDSSRSVVVGRQLC